MHRARAHGQTLLLMALTMLLVVLMACMTLAITTRVRQKLELQTVSDTVAYSQAVATARTFNATGIVNRAIVSHWVAMLGIQANVAWGSSVTAYFDAYAFKFNELLTEGRACTSGPQERERVRELKAARDAFMHASFSMWKPPPGRFDDVSIPFCSAGKCFPRVDSGRLENEVIRESKEVRASIRDLVGVQTSLYWQLTNDLGSQAMASQIASMAKGGNGGDIFPYQLQTGGNVVPVAQREFQGAIGSRRSDLMPIAHAAMGSRGNRFVMSGSEPAFDSGGLSYKGVLPRRARIYVARIQAALNARFGKSSSGLPRFNFGVASNLTATFLDNGGMAEDFDDGDFDTAVAEATDGDGTEDADTVPPDDDVSPPTFYNADKVFRVTPSRSLGYTYAVSRHEGSFTYTWRGPCYGRSGTSFISSIARAHTQMDDPAVSSHEWAYLRDVNRATEDPDDDGSREIVESGRNILHGTASGSHGYEVDNHRPPRCHPWHRHWYEMSDLSHVIGREEAGMGLAPGGFGFVFPGASVNCDARMSAEECRARPDMSGAAGAFGQPKTPILLTRQTSGNGLVPDPWDLTVSFRLSAADADPELDLKKASSAQPLAAISTGIAYYHRRCDRYRSAAWNPLQMPKRRSQCISWNEAPNMLNPFWRATLVPINVDEQDDADDRTPGMRLTNDAARMLAGSGLTDAAITYRKLARAGYEGIQ